MPEISTIFEHDNEQGVTGILGIDENAQLYWNGQRIVTEQRITLNWWVNASIILSGISTAVIAVFTILLYLKPT